jgi:hypothetical protein
MPLGDIFTEIPPSEAASIDGGVVLSELIDSVQGGGVVYLTRDGSVVGAVAPLDVVEAGLRALGGGESPDGAI